MWYLMPLGAPAGAAPAPGQQGAPAVPNVIPFPQRRAQTNVLVRDGSGDHWADVIGPLRDLAPSVAHPHGIDQYDAMEGRPSPESLSALAPLLSEFPGAADGLRSGESMDVPKGRTARPAVRDLGDR